MWLIARCLVLFQSRKFKEACTLADRGMKSHLTCSHEIKGNEHVHVHYIANRVRYYWQEEVLIKPTQTLSYTSLYCVHTTQLNRVRTGPDWFMKLV